jgi:hypothetical protein
VLHRRWRGGGGGRRGGVPSVREGGTGEGEAAGGEAGVQRA